MTPTPSPGDAAYQGGSRTLSYVASALVVGSSVVAALAITSSLGGHWEWGPFLASLLVTAAGVGCIEGLRAGMVARAKPTPEQRRRLQESRRIRKGPVTATCVALAAAVGLVSGAIPSYWPVVGLALLILVLGIVLPVLVLAWARRRVRRSQDGVSA